MKLLVTGATGVIGAAAVPALFGAGHTLRLLSRRIDAEAARFPPEIERFAADLSDPAQLTGAVDDCDTVVHIAGIEEERPPTATFDKINVEGTRALCSLAAAAPAPPFFVYVSSLAADRGQSDYHRSKREAETIVRGYRGPWLILRPGNIYGPGDETVSMLLKLSRNLPVVPLVDGGDQPFQPLWFEDFGASLAAAVARRDLAGRTLELAGTETTTTLDLLDRFGSLTGRNPPRLPVPSSVARIGTAIAESLGGREGNLLRTVGLEPPLNTGKLQMLLEGSVIADPAGNALVSVFHLTPTSLHEGLERLTDLTPEQLPGEGLGATERSVYSAHIQGSRFTPERLLDEVCTHFPELLPIEMTAEPGSATALAPGATLTGNLPGRGHFQVRVLERDADRVTLVTLAGHPLAGVLIFSAHASPAGIRFAIETVSQASNVFDWLALHTFGGTIQQQNWRAVVRRVVELSGGSAPDGVACQREHLSADDTDALAAHLTQRIDELQRHELERAARRRTPDDV